MSTAKICTFCKNKGIQGPHDHMVRDFSKKGAPIICPELLNLECRYCKGKGHTVNYCKVLKEKNGPPIVTISVIKSDNSNTRCVHHGDGFVAVKRSGKTQTDYAVNKVQKIGTLTSMFAGLDVEEIENEAMVEGETKCGVRSSWANVVSQSHKGMPLVCRAKLCEQLGITKTKCWSDDDEEDYNMF